MNRYTAKSNVTKAVIIALSLHLLIYASALAFYYEDIIDIGITNIGYYAKEFGVILCTCVVAFFFIASLRDITTKRIIYYYVIPLSVVLASMIVGSGLLIYVFDMKYVVLPISCVPLSLIIIWGGTMIVSSL